MLGALNRSVSRLPVVLLFAPTGSANGIARRLYPDPHDGVDDLGFVGIDSYTHDDLFTALMTCILPDVPSCKRTYRLRRNAKLENDPFTRIQNNAYSPIANLMT